MAARNARPQARRHYKTKGTLTPDEWAGLIVEEAGALGYKITVRQVAEGLGVIKWESSGNSSNEVQGPEGHIGGWALGTEGFPSSPAVRLDPRKSTRAALENWHSNGKSWWQAWGKWELEQSGKSGTSAWPEFANVARRAVHGVGSPPPRATRRRSATVPLEPQEASAGGGDLAGGLMHFGLVVVLVVGGIVMLGLGTTRVLGPAKKAPA